MQSLRSGLRILNELSRAGRELTVTDIANRLKMTKSQVSRMLAVFREEGWVTQNSATRGFSIGITAYRAGVRFISTNRLSRETLPLLKAVVDGSGFTCTLSVWHDGKPFYLLGIDGSISVDFAARVGTYFPCHATASGKLLTAFADATLRTSALQAGLTRYTPQTIINLDDLETEMRLIKERGYATSNAERIAGVGALAVPVFGERDQFVASLGVSYPLNLVPLEKHEYYVTILHAQARKLSLRLGANDYRYAKESGLAIEAFDI